MADSRNLSNQQSELGQILQEAHHRWLRSTEICQILSNYQNFQLAPEPPVRPPAGSLFLFDRKSLRYFRKDGHRWRKKNDGKTVKEAHEKLKVGSVDVLHCYYAHGEDNENFQRRSYWMLDRQLEHIVLVHYREVEEGYKSGISRSQADPASQNGSPETSSAGCFVEANSSAPTTQNSCTSSPNGVELRGQTFSSEFEGFPKSSKNYPVSLHADAAFHYGSGSSMWYKFHGSSVSPDGVCNQTFPGKPSGADILIHKLSDPKLEASGAVQVQQVHGLITVHPEVQKNSYSRTAVTSTFKVENKSKDGRSNNDESGELKKLDSFGRWMDKEMGGDCDDSLMASDSGNYWNNTLGAGNDGKEVSSLSGHMHLDIDSVGPSLSQDQLFSVCDFSPDWAYSGVETKVLIAGSFLGSRNHMAGTKWGCMFGEIEVSAEVLNNNVIRCQTPSHAPGRVPFYITCSNRLACSEVREFEYCENPPGVAFSMAVKIESEEELRFQMRLAKLLCLGPERKWLDCSIKECDKCKLGRSIYSMKSENKIAEKLIEGNSTTSEVDHVHFRDALIQNLLKDRLCEWLVYKVHEGGNGPRILNDAGLGVIHLAAALGYEWAMGPIIATGIHPNFRDARGRTGLHWASYYGREETVTALVRLGAAPGAVEDPTPSFPGGQTAADLASSRGHKGIAGFLAEADLTSHLSSLTVKEFVRDSVAVTTADQKAIETTAQVVPLSGSTNEDLSLKGSLAAVRKSAYAASLIQELFRTRSFRHKQLTKSSNDISEVSCDLVALGFLDKVQKVSHFEDYLHSAAVKIQQRYRGWKRRKEFLKIRNRIVRIQAHVRGHRERQRYKKFVWSVSVVEKAILRWRRKGAGLRGFQVDKATRDAIPRIEKTDEYEFLRIGRRQKCAGVEKALARVKSMARNPEARDQYMRLVSKFENSRDNEGTSSSLL